MNTFRKISILVVLLSLSTAAFAPLGQGAENVRITQIDTTRFPRVTFYVSVTDADGEPRAVDASRFIINEDGQQIPLDQIEGIGEVGPLTTLLVMDISGSMNSAGKLDSAKSAAHEFIDRMRDIDQAGIIAFNTQVQTVQDLTSDADALHSAIDGLAADGQTAMYDALLVAIDQLEGVGGRKAIIVLTDGLDNSSSADTDRVVKRIGPAGFSVSTVGLGVPADVLDEMTGIDEEGLQDLSDRAGGVYGYAEDKDSLRRLYETYAVSMQSEYAITYTSPAELRDGVNRSLSVSLAPIGGGKAEAGGDTRYNPGGLVPEVEQPASWPVFAAVVLGLAALVAIPLVLTGFRSGATETAGGRSSTRGGKVKLKKQLPARIKLK
ncbi:MAG TPA: VWA domain-containing protein [Anaerolineales bacterium]|nr:VWA domain-containing protein [Anaerolineales bacterium]